ncbi:MAG: Asp-tRNA(Asn)/Glu-tRNA(Gln) amidotransferase subunit GatA, partial [Ureaplasma sp.]|nr:Asp-tRNA(Asn)/Glu-tRNA(Gln) amidotransferase subunit GatA [Ureaplasma sp.]
MKKNSLTILDIHNDLINKKTNFTKIAKFYAKNTKRLIKENTNAITTDLSNLSIIEAKKLDKLFKLNQLDLNNLLLGSVCSLKDNMCLENIKTTGGSLFLKSYTPSYSATVAKLLINDNVLINSKSNMDELGLGGTGTFSGFGLVKNISFPERITGGSSSGTVLAIKEKAATFGIATDTGDSIRRPCSFMGLYGLKPTYGLVSRYGVLPYAPSLDHVGIVANSIQDLAIVLSSIAKNDINDHT